MLPDMTESPMNRTPKPRTTSPIFFTRSFFTNCVISTPTNRNTGAYADRLKDTSCEVTVVPMLAPMITPAAWYSVIIPALTKLTTMTVVALEDWITAQKRIPTSVPRIRFVVTASRMLRILAPAAFSRPSLICFMPSRKSPSPPISDTITLISIITLPH